MNFFLQQARTGYHHRRYWVLQQAYHRKESVSYVVDTVAKSQKMYSKWSGFYGPNGFMGGYVMSRNHYKVHGQPNTVCRLLL